MNETMLKLIEACEQMLHVCGEDEEQDEAFDWVRDVVREAKELA